MECDKKMYTTIRIKRSTKELIETIGKKNQTYDEIIANAITKMVEASK